MLNAIIIYTKAFQETCSMLPFDAYLSLIIILSFERPHYTSLRFYRHI